MGFSYISNAQIEYNKFIQSYSNQFLRNDNNLSLICSFLDLVNTFWLERLEPIIFEIDEATNKNDVLLLSGEITLDFTKKDHFYFISLGNFHLIPDPFIKIDVFFRRSASEIARQNYFNEFIYAFCETQALLMDYSDMFNYLPMGLIMDRMFIDRFGLIDRIFWDFISTIFEKQIASYEELSSLYESYEDIEESIDPTKLKSIIFWDFSDRKLSVRKRIERYLANRPELIFLIKDKSECFTFSLLLNSRIAQMLDIVVQCISLDLIPYIMDDVIINYLLLIIETFSDEPKSKELLLKSFYAYIFYSTINPNYFEKLSLQDYFGKISQYDFLSEVIKYAGEIKFNPHTGSIAPIVEYMKDFVGDLIIPR